METFGPIAKKAKRDLEEGTAKAKGQSQEATPQSAKQLQRATEGTIHPSVQCGTTWSHRGATTPCAA